MGIKSNKKSGSDAEEKKKLLKSAKAASTIAKKVSVALDLPIRTISKGTLIEKKPNGEIITIKVIKKAKSNKSGIKKGTVLCLK